MLVPGFEGLVFGVRPFLVHHRSGFHFPQPAALVGSVLCQSLFLAYLFFSSSFVRRLYCTARLSELKREIPKGKACLLWVGGLNGSPVKNQTISNAQDE